MSFDLDPGEGVSIREAAQLVHALLKELGLTAFLKTSGGKGLHVVVPLKPAFGWDTVKDFSQAIVRHLSAVIPERFVAQSGPSNRAGKIFPDYLRNGFGAGRLGRAGRSERPGALDGGKNLKERQNRSKLMPRCRTVLTSSRAPS